jgi:hypothetical protein
VRLLSFLMCGVDSKRILEDKRAFLVQFQSIDYSNKLSLAGNITKSETNGILLHKKKSAQLINKHWHVQPDDVSLLAKNSIKKHC